MLDGIKIKLYKVDGHIRIRGHLYTPHCRMTECGIITATGVPVILVNDNTILADRLYVNNIYKKRSQWFGFKTEYVHVTPTGSITVNYNNTLNINEYEVHST